MTSRSSLYGPADQPDQDAAYYPDATWQYRTPSESGVSPDLVKQAIDFAVAGETKAPRDLVMNHIKLRPRTVRLRDRADQGTRRSDRNHHSQWLHRR